MRHALVPVCLLLTCSHVSALASTPGQVRAAVSQAGGTEKLLSAIAANTAKSAGQMIDAETQLTGAAAVGRTMVHYLRLVNLERKDIPDLPALRAAAARTLSQSICTAPVSATLINEFGAEYKYMAYSKSRTFLFEYAFNKGTCSPNYRW